MPTLILQAQQTARVWAASGGDEVLTLTSLANNAGRKGDGHDWGASHAGRVVVELKTAFAVGPTAGNIVEVYWCSSRDNSLFDGNQAVGDAALTDTDVNKQLHWIGNLVADNVTTVQVQSWVFYLPGRYGFPVVYNRSGQALSATAGDHRLAITPLPDEVQ